MPTPSQQEKELIERAKEHFNQIPVKYVNLITAYFLSEIRSAVEAREREIVAECEKLCKNVMKIEIKAKENA